MAKSKFVTDLPDISQNYRPFHQYVWPIWEEREELRQPHQLGFSKLGGNGQNFQIVQNGSTALTAADRGKFVAPTITSDAFTNLPEKTDLLNNRVKIDVPASRTTTARAENLFEDGMFIVTGGTGAGLAFPIEASDAIVDSTDDTEIVVTLAAELFIELDTTTDVKLVSSPFRNFAVGGEDSAFGGILIDVADADAYFWLQTHGPSVGRGDAAISEGDALTPAAGGELITATAGQPIVAYALEDPSAANEVFAIYLV